jgi:rhodanese-related sulfurtransferase
MIQPITVEALAELVESGSLDDPELPGGTVRIFDLRDAAAYESAHVPGARHLPSGDHYPIRWVPQRCHTQELIVLIDDEGKSGGPARHVAHELAHMWFRRLRYLAGGFEAWRAAGRPTESGGPTGSSAASFEGTRDEVHRSSDVPWETPMDRP